MFIRRVITGIPIVTFTRPSLEIDTPVEIDLEAAPVSGTAPSRMLINGTMGR